MSQPWDERLYNLLPVLYHQRDLENGQALRALMAVLENELRTIETDTAAAYNNWFIQTCDAWVIPYIADLVGIHDMSQAKYLFSTQRRQVANTIAYRRRKGTLPVLEHVLRDATGWLVRAVELSQSVATTQPVRYMPSDWSRTVDLRSSASLAHLQGPSNQVPRTIDIHNVETDSPRVGKYGLNQIGLFFWRLRSYLVKSSPARAIGKVESMRSFYYTFDLLGRDMPLFNYTQFIGEISQRAEDIHMPLRLTREVLAIDLKDYADRYQERPEEDQPRNSAFYGPDRGLTVSVPDGRPDGKFKDILPIKVMSADLSVWPAANVIQAWAQDKDVAIDVNLGRLVLLKPPKQPGEIKVNYCYGLSDEIGGGPYRRSVQLTNAEQNGFTINVAKGTTTHTLEQALDEWEEYCWKEYGNNNLNPSGVIRILDNGVYGGNIVIRLPPGAQLALIAENGARPVIRPIGTVNVIYASIDTIRAEVNRRTKTEHTWQAEDMAKRQKTILERQFLLNGIWVSGGIHINAEKPSPAPEKPTATNRNDIRESGRAPNSTEQTTSPALEKLTVTIGHCTLMPNGLKVTLDDAARGLQIAIDHSVVGPLYVPAVMGGLTVTDSILDHAGRGAGYAIAGDNKGALGPAVTLERVTVFGQVKAAQVTACDVIFTQRVIAPQPTSLDQQVRFSYVPEDSVTPTGEPYRPVSKMIEPPVFTSRHFGDPAYAQLSEDCPREIRGGASDGSEMGAFHELHSMEAEANIPTILEEYLPVGLQASITYMT